MSCASAKWLNISQFSSTGIGVVLEVNNRDTKVCSWSAHVIRLIVPIPFINIEFEDRGEVFTWFSTYKSTLKNHLKNEQA